MPITEIDIMVVFERIDYHLALALKRYHIHRNEIDDLRQDIVLAVLIRSHEFDSTLASWTTFLNMVIESEIKYFRYKKRWQKNQSFVSIDDLTENEHPLTNFYPACELNDLERRVFFSEIRSVIDALPEILREICQFLPTFTPFEIAGRLQIPRKILKHHLKNIQRLLNESKIIQEFFRL
jgi:DNA-directed RNA polymerase specialized sigma24 family protein